MLQVLSYTNSSWRLETGDWWRCNRAAGNVMSERGLKITARCTSPIVHPHKLINPIFELSVAYSLCLAFSSLLPLLAARSKREKGKRHQACEGFVRSTRYLPLDALVAISPMHYYYYNYSYK